MKLAITGKGGVGKTTLAAGLALRFAAAGDRVIAVDADPDSNLAATLGVAEPEGIASLVDDRDLIEARTGARPGAPGALFRLNPKVDDLPERLSVQVRGIRLLAIGGGRRVGGSGCFCPESTMLRALLSHLVLERDDVVILDMDAGIEHLTRGTAQGVDAMFVLVEPGRRSVETARRIASLAADLGFERIWLVANKLRDDRDRRFVMTEARPLEIAGYLPFSEEVRGSGMDGIDLERTFDGPFGRELDALRIRLRDSLKRDIPDVPESPLRRG